MCHTNIHILHGLYNNMCFDQCIYEVPWFTFLKGPLAQVQLCVLIPESLIELCLCFIKEVFVVGFMFCNVPKNRRKKNI